MFKQLSPGLTVPLMGINTLHLSFQRRAVKKIKGARYYLVGVELNRLVPMKTIIYSGI
jgi:hypothetical protein